MRRVGVFAGLATLDVVLHAPHPPAADEKVTADAVDIDVGGPAANAARTFAALGGRAVLVAAVGDHPAARLIRAGLDALGVRLVDLAAGSETPPPVASVVVDVGGGRAVTGTVTPRTAGIVIEPDAVGDLLDGAGVLLCDGHLSTAAIALARRAAERGLPLVVDAGRPKPVFEELLPLATHTVCAQSWAGDVPPLGPRGALTAVTAGSGPVRWWTPTGHGALTPPRVDVASTLGAGDVLHGALAHAVAAGAAPVEALELGIGLASRRCTWASLTGWLGTLQR